ncbi:MAG: Phosphoglycerate kinase [Candidatus Roizmanbacteria bacterium GW2011_GWC2_37_13]|uniref:Phosphoglycerate kinase n=1 Tax=Candidatus Roizmanbacteria bacterium GW2011_GWC2_37_13 TaxID=1618486 RepID=A0A0G0G2X1_9BACT|nr:MAG: Phosphoglycerate kinase [Candidatus Roizmanbacteria bacterium GW2011_GWC1_37_12]KKQ25533.1 MAG: Phosphoglycerate kinase [Candidatus Roizmanbacteria bacterium GW2011_GWC2_37_13]
MSKVTYIDETEIKNKTILVRVDFDVSLNPDHSIANDIRIQQNLPTLKYLLKKNNRLICVAKLNRPKTRDPKHSLKPVVKRLQEYLPDYKITLVDDFLTCDQKIFKEQKPKEILVLENIRFYPKEKDYSTIFARKLASLAEVYVNDGFAVSHRTETSVIGPPKFIPGYGGLLLKKELSMIDQAIKDPKKPIVAIIGGAKVSTKIGLVNKLIKIVDYLIIGGGLANTFVCAQGLEIGTSFCEYEAVQLARRLLSLAKKNRALIILPVDAVVAESKDNHTSEVVKIESIPPKKSIFDIGPETKAQIGGIIAKAKTIIWNGPVGYFENPVFRQGTDFVYYSIAHNPDAISIVGGGDTLAAISKKEYLDKITHISTGGGAMLEYIEKGTLPGIEALKR